MADFKRFIDNVEKLVKDRSPLTLGAEDLQGCEYEYQEKQSVQEARPVLTAFEQDLRRLINKHRLINEHCMENVSDTPDNILAEYMCACLNAFNVATNQRRKWHSR
jgi:hypothetical protein